MAAEIHHNGVPVTVIDGCYLDHNQPTTSASEYISQLVQGLDAIRQFAADKLTELYNKNWTDDDHPTLNRSSFIERLVNPTITLYDEMGAAVVYFEDSDMFSGHWIEVSVNNGIPEYAGIIG